MIVDLFAGRSDYVVGMVEGLCIPPPEAAWDNGNGYWRITLADRRPYTHVLAWEAENGPVPDGLVVDHLCRRRWCCNAAHLEPVTNVENIMRGESPPAQNARKEVCPTCGDPYTVEVTGYRRCLPCRFARRVAVGETSGRGCSAERTHCPLDHPYDEENTYLVLKPDGSVKNRQCKECGRRRVRERRAAARQKEVRASDS